MTIVKDVIRLFENLLNDNESPKKQVLVIVNTDDDYGLYVQRLMRTFKKLGLKVRSKEEFRTIKSDDAIVVGDGYLFESGDEFDVRVEKYPYNTFADPRYKLDDEDFRVLSLVQDLSKIEKQLKEEYYVAPRQVTATRQNVLHTIAQQGGDYMSNTDFLDLLDELDEVLRIVPQPVTVACKQEVRIHDNFVKIDYKNYKTHIDTHSGVKFILLDGVRYDIVSDRYGRKFLRKH